MNACGGLGVYLVSNVKSWVTYESGIICTNSGVRQDHFPACNGAWCTMCFIAHPLDPFEVKMPRDFMVHPWLNLKKEIHFKQARPGDHLCIPFQCPNCQSQNIRGQRIDTTRIDDLVFECMVVRVTLDAFWSRASKTIVNHVQEVRNMAQYGRMFQYPPMLVLGP
jgi:hypothetical protein